MSRLCRESSSSRSSGGEQLDVANSEQTQRLRIIGWGMSFVPEGEKSLDEGLPGDTEAAFAKQGRDQPQQRQAASGEDQGVVHGKLRGKNAHGPRPGGRGSVKKTFKNHRSGASDYAAVLRFIKRGRSVSFFDTPITVVEPSAGQLSAEVWPLGSRRVLPVGGR